MAISQGFNLPPTGRIGRTTTGHRSGNYNLRVIPDVDANAERSEKQKAENSKFGFLSDMLNQNLEYLKIGFPKAYQPLNYAIKKNISLVSKTENGFEFDFEKAVFSEGKLKPAYPTNLFLRNSASFRYAIGYTFLNDPIGLQSVNDRIFVILYIHEIGKLIIRETNDIRAGLNNSHTYYVRNLQDFIGKHISLSIYFRNNVIGVSNTAFFGTLLANWN